METEEEGWLTGPAVELLLAGGGVQPGDLLMVMLGRTTSRSDGWKRDCMKEYRNIPFKVRRLSGANFMGDFLSDPLSLPTHIPRATFDRFGWSVEPKEIVAWKRPGTSS